MVPFDINAIIDAVSKQQMKPFDLKTINQLVAESQGQTAPVAGIDFNRLLAESQQADAEQQPQPLDIQQQADAEQQSQPIESNDVSSGPWSFLKNLGNVVAGVGSVGLIPLAQQKSKMQAERAVRDATIRAAEMYDDPNQIREEVKKAVPNAYGQVDYSKIFKEIADANTGIQHYDLSTLTNQYAKGKMLRQIDRMDFANGGESLVSDVPVGGLIRQFKPNDKWRKSGINLETLRAMADQQFGLGVEPSGKLDPDTGTPIYTVKNPENWDKYIDAISKMKNKPENTIQNLESFFDVDSIRKRAEEQKQAKLKLDQDKLEHEKNKESNRQNRFWAKEDDELLREARLLADKSVGGQVNRDKIYQSLKTNKPLPTDIKWIDALAMKDYADDIQGASFYRKQAQDYAADFNLDTESVFNQDGTLIVDDAKLPGALDKNNKPNSERRKYIELRNIWAKAKQYEDSKSSLIESLDPDKSKKKGIKGTTKSIWQ